MKANFTLTFTIAPAESAITATNTDFKGVVGQPFNDNIGLKGGNGAITITGVDDPANIPPGLTIDPTGAISGTPTKDGVFNLGISVQDVDG